MKTAMWLNALILRGMLVLALVMAAVGPLAVPSQAAPADVTFTVNYNGDIHDASLDGICDGGVGDVCTLREAIEESNAATGYKTVAFDSGMAGQTIYLSYGPLTISTDNLTIDATTSGGDVIVDSGGLTANSNLFEVQGNYNTIRGLMLQGWPDARYPDSDHGHGVRIYDPTASGMASYNMLDTLRIYGFEHDGILEGWWTDADAGIAWRREFCGLCVDPRKWTDAQGGKHYQISGLGLEDVLVRTIIEPLWINRISS